jgi:predicted nucleotidyltransferase
MNDQDTLKAIQDKLAAIEAEQAVRILYACESGSRAWGFPSPDSDYDVRFLYVHPEVHYLSIREHHDVIELPVNEVLDINGWDLRKALRLYWKSNAALYEWIQSPVVYRDGEGLASKLRTHAPMFYSLRAGLHHYQNMARHILLNDLQGEEVKLKKYFYALRPQLAAKWITERRTVPPMEFGKLLTQIEAQQDLLATIHSLWRQKAEADEKARVKRNDRLNEWLLLEYERCDMALADPSTERIDQTLLDALFRSYVR